MLHAYRHAFIQTLLKTQCFHTTKTETAALRDKCFSQMEDTSLREQILTQLESRYAKEILGDYYWEQDDGA